MAPEVSPEILAFLLDRTLLGQLGDTLVVENILRESPPSSCTEGETIIKQNTNTAEGADHDANIRSFKGKYGPNYEQFSSLTKEILNS